MADLPKSNLSDPLQDLLTRAMARQTPKGPRKSTAERILAGEVSVAAKRIREIFSNPENWLHVRYVTLIHEESNTLLGNFEELKHKTAVGVCRKFLRVEGPKEVNDIEYVQGENWHAVDLAKMKLPSEIEEREMICDIKLPEMDNVFAPAVLVTVHLEHGGIAKVVLEDETRFFSKERRVQLILPAGLDVLEGMSLDSKLDLRKALGL